MYLLTSLFICLLNLCILHSYLGIMLCGHENVSPSQKFIPYCLSFFPNDEQYK
jgi:hypothetical protein